MYEMVRFVIGLDSSSNMYAFIVQMALTLVVHEQKIFPSCNSQSDSGADPGFDRGGGGQIVTGLNCPQYTAASCERSEPFSAWGPGPALGSQTLLGVSLPFYTIFEIIKY